MIEATINRMYPSVKSLVRDMVASRIHAKDATLYDFSDNAQRCAEEFMGWTDLASNPPVPLDDIIAFAEKVREDGLDEILLLGEGGSTQAPMTITKYNSIESDVKFRTLDSVSPVRTRSILSQVDPKRVLVIVSSKSGSTIEPMSNLIAVRDYLSKYISKKKLGSHFVAITDPGSDLEKKARAEGWRKIFNGEPSVGGRYSALSVFGLVPAALVGIDLNKFIASAAAAEKACSENTVDNPAAKLAAFLYDNWCKGRDKVCFLSPKRGRVLGLWIEQLVAESLGKNGKGILPNIAPDSLDLENDCMHDRVACVYLTKTDLWDERKNFEMSLSVIADSIPTMDFRVDSVYQLAADFVMWEYAVAMCGVLMRECPFDQPDVASAKAATLDVLRDGAGNPDYVTRFIGDSWVGDIEVRASDALYDFTDGILGDSIAALMESIKPGDYVAINAFIPFTGEGRREGLDSIRHSFAHMFGNVACLEIGPRYLHSTGQLQKGGDANGVFLIISSDELRDIELGEWKAPSLASLAKAQAIGDYNVLAERGRRVLHVHLPDNTGTTLKRFAELICRTAHNVTEAKYTSFCAIPRKGPQYNDAVNKNNALMYKNQENNVIDILNDNRENDAKTRHAKHAENQESRAKNKIDNDNDDLDKEFDFSNSIPNPYYKKIRINRDE